MSAYYNENDPKAAATLRELIHERLIAPGILRGAGNAINSQVAKAFIQSVMEVIG